MTERRKFPGFAIQEIRGRELLVASLFALAMAYMEAAVVVYLRELYYPNGFDFPLASMDAELAITEIFREASTIIMLLAAAFMLGRTRSARLAWFLYCFAVWDIFYYVFLKILLNWPAGLLTWDILFLIPFTWTGPVVAPLINSASMILLALFILSNAGREHCMPVGREWILLIAGSVVVIAAYTQEYLSHMLSRFTVMELLGMAPLGELMQHADGFIPLRFNWWMFLAGQIILFSAIIHYALRNGK